MQSNRSLSVLKLLIAVSLLIVLTHIVLKYISVVVYGEQHGFLFELSNRFDLNDENSVPQWLSQALFLAVSASAGLAAYMSKSRMLRRLWSAVAVVGLILSIDDVATMHEFVLQTVHNLLFADELPTLLRNSWLILLPFVLIGLVILLVQAVRLLPRRTATLLAVGSMVFVIGAVLVDSFINNVPERSFLGQGLLGALEGGLQLIGSSVFLFAILDYLERNHAAAIKNALRALKSS